MASRLPAKSLTVTAPGTSPARRIHSVKVAGLKWREAFTVSD